MVFFFYTLAIITLMGALGAVLLKNLIHCALCLILFFLGTAGLFVLLRADFIAAVQILVYVGAVTTLLLFGIMLTQNVVGETMPKGLGQNRWWALGVSVALIGILGTTIRHQHFPFLAPAEKLATQEIGHALMTTYVLPFEVVSVLLTAILIGAIVIAMEQQKKTSNGKRSTSDERRK